MVNEAARRIGLYDATARLLQRAQDAGGVHRDITIIDVVRIFYAVAEVVEAGHGEAWERFVAVSQRGVLTHPRPWRRSSAVCEFSRGAGSVTTGAIASPRISTTPAQPRSLGWKWSSATLPRQLRMRGRGTCPHYRSATRYPRRTP